MSIDIADTSALLVARGLHHVIDALDTEAQHAIDGADVEELAHLHVALVKAKQRLATICTIVEQVLVDVMPDKRLELPGLPVLERRRGTDRKAWQSVDLLDELFRRAVVDTTTGEVLDDEALIRQRLHEVLVDCVPFTGSLGWRVTALRDLGIEPDEWCQTSPGRVSIQVHEEAAR